ncbi:WXG100 family type VII secretion target [Streptomyces sp. NPDC059740]|uniref:WXG100 family type VII secretion target n=1 Tax=Streptomyces sp. NPDC059740 TaxID=3346926 RepID=UPI00364F9139
MSDSGFDVDVDQLKNSAPAFSREASAVAQAASRLRHALAGLGEPWGEDEQGQKFAHVYTPHLHSIEKATAALTKGLHSIHDAMRDMAANHEEADHRSASGFDAHRRER